MDNASATLAYRSAGLQTATGPRLVVHAYEFVADHLSAASLAMGAGRRVDKAVHVSKALHGITELRSVLDMDAGSELAVNLDRLYAWFSARLVDANLRDDRRQIEEIRAHWQELLSAWRDSPTDNLP